MSDIVGTCEPRASCIMPTFSYSHSLWAFRDLRLSSESLVWSFPTYGSKFRSGFTPPQSCRYPRISQPLAGLERESSVNGDA